MDGYEKLKIAILQTVINDLKKAIKKGQNNKIAQLESWFLSEWGQFLSNEKGQYIIEQCHKSFDKKSKKFRV